MCNRCGTGSIARCTDPTRHARPTSAHDKIGEAYAILCAVTAQAARGALSEGLSPEDVAAELESLADAITGRTDVAESMYPIPQIPRDAWVAAGVDFSEVD